MKRLKKIGVILGLVLLILSFHPARAYAGGGHNGDNDKVVIGSTYTLHDGDVLNGDLVIVGGTVTLEEGSVVNGDVVVVAGTLTSSSVIHGNLVALVSSIKLDDNAVVKGDFATLASSARRGGETVIQGQVLTGFDFPVGIRGRTQPFSVGVFSPALLSDGTLFFKVIWVVFRVLIWGFLASVLMLLFPKHVERVANTVAANPGGSLAAGGLVLLLAPIAILIFLVTIILIPVSFLGVLALFVAWAFGLIAIGTMLGEKIMQSQNQKWAPSIIAGVGTLILMSLLLGIDSLVWCIGGLPKLLAGILGLGAVLMTWLGSQKNTVDSIAEKTTEEAPGD